MNENGMSDSQARNSLSNTPTHHVWSLIERVMEKQRCETIRHNFFSFASSSKKRGVVVLAKKKMNKRKPSPRAQKQTSCKKKKLQTKKAKGGKAAASSGEQEEDETKGTSAVYVAVQPTLFFFSCRRSAHSSLTISVSSSYVFSALLTSDTVWRWTRVSAFSSASLASSVRPSVRRGTVGRTNARTHESQRARSAFVSFASRSRRFFFIFFFKNSLTSFVSLSQKTTHSTTTAMTALL